MGKVSNYFGEYQARMRAPFGFAQDKQQAAPLHGRFGGQDEDGAIGAGDDGFGDGD
jgi:hypothetical protein